MAESYLIGKFLTISVLLVLTNGKNPAPFRALASAPGSASHPALRPGDGSKLV
jgi:hypothetical protein